MRKRIYWMFMSAVFLLIALPAHAVNYEGPGLVQAPMITQTLERVGVVNVWNTGDKFQMSIDAVDSWELRNVQIYVGNDPVPATKKGNLVPGRFNYKDEYANSADNHRLVLDLEADLDFHWGTPYVDLRDLNLAVHISAVKLDEDGNPGASQAAWAYTGTGVDSEIGEIDEAMLDALEFEGVGKGWVFGYKLSHPSRGHFIDSPVGGLNFWTPTHSNLTDEAGAFDHFPDETVTFAIGNYVIGSTVADHKVSPLDFFAASDTEDSRVINMGRLLQSLDSDAYPKDGITITPEVVAAFESTMGNLGLDFIDFSDDAQIDAIIEGTIAEAELAEIYLAEVSAEEAKAHLDETLNNVMFRKNISKTPAQGSAKAKMNIMTMWLPVLQANADGNSVPVEIKHFDEEGNLIRTATEAKPIVTTYTAADPVTGAHDVWAAVSRDDGETWKRMNLSRSADLSSFTLANGEPYYGACKKPVFQVKGNKILVAWSSKFARGGKPGYAIQADDPDTDVVDEGDDYPYDDPYYVDDIWGVGGPQRSHDYTEDGFPEVGEVPYSALWVARGIIATQADVDKDVGEFVGDIVWFKPERVTSGRRDVNQIFVGAGSGAGFAMVWQEDPNGLRPGRAVGPGPGWGGATTSHKTDIWYSYLAWGNHTKVDSNFESQHAYVDDVPWESNRPKALVPMSLPVRLSDNDVLNKKNMGLDETAPTEEPIVTTLSTLAEEDDINNGTHRYGLEVEGLLSGEYYEFLNNADAPTSVAITTDGMLMDGDTGASRANVFLQPYTAIKADGTTYTSAWAIITYEETKGAGSGPPEDTDEQVTHSDDYIPESGKNVIYHSFDFKTPDLVAAGDIMNPPEFDIDGNLVYLVDEEGGDILDWQDKKQLAYENSRRGRFILQGIGAIKNSRTIMLMVYKMGEEGSGRPSDIMMQRWVVPATDVLVGYVQNTETEGGTETEVIHPDNPYRFENIFGTLATDDASGVEYWASGPVNMSSVTPMVKTDSMGDPEVEDAYGAVKVVEWAQTVENLEDSTWLNPWDDARAHRGQIRGDFVQLGFSYTPNWAAARNGHDKYDFYIRRSFNGGATWTTKPASQGGTGVTHCITWTTPSGEDLVAGTKEEVCTTYAAGDFETMRNLSQLGNAKTSVIEPRIVAVPGTIKVNGAWTGILEDKQNANVFYVAWGTSTNPVKDPITGEQEEPAPMDLFYSFSRDKGESYYLDEWIVNGTPVNDEITTGETVFRFPWMAKGPQEQGEVQLRMTPDGSRFYGSWLDEGEEGSDIVFRRIMSADFPQNNAVVPATDETVPAAEEAGSMDDFSSDSGGGDD